MGTKITSLVQDNNEVEVEFNDGSKSTYDLVIGCDGIHSTTRTSVFPNTDPYYFGIRYFSFWMDDTCLRSSLGEKFDSNSFSFVFGNGSFAGLFSIRGRMAVFAGVRVPEGLTTDVETRWERMRDLFKEHEGFLKVVLKNLPPANDIFEGNFQHLSMNEWYRGRVALLGDSCAPVLPTSGAGAVMAIESAGILVEALNTHTNANLSEALANYERSRGLRVFFVQQQGTWMAKCIQTNPVLNAARNMMTKMTVEKMVSMTMSVVMAAE